MARAKRDVTPAPAPAPGGQESIKVPADLFAGYGMPAVEEVPVETAPAPAPAQPAPTPTSTSTPAPAPASTPAPKVTAASAVIASLEGEKYPVKAPDNGSGTLMRTSRGWIFMDIDGPAVERAVAAAREAQPGVTLDVVASLIGGWAHDHGRLFRTVTNIY